MRRWTNGTNGRDAEEDSPRHGRPAGDGPGGRHRFEEAEETTVTPLRLAMATAPTARRLRDALLPKGPPPGPVAVESDRWPVEWHRALTPHQHPVRAHPDRTPRGV